MKKSELIMILSSSDEEEVFIKTGDNRLEDIETEHIEESFDGFDTVSPVAMAGKAAKVEGDE